MLRCVIAALDGSRFEIDVSVCAKGEECLEKACLHQGVVPEMDYFGLQFSGPQGELLWLNRRNYVSSQVYGQAPYKFSLRVKFFVLPHLLLQESSRHQFFLQAKAEFDAGRLSSASEELQLQAAIALGGLECSCHCSPSAAGSERTEEPQPCQSCCTPRQQTALQASQEYVALKLLAQLDGYGYEWHEAKIIHRVDRVDTCVAEVQMAVADQGIAFYTAIQPSELLFMIEFATVTKVTHKWQTVTIEYREGSEANSAAVLLTLNSDQAADAFFRSVTERHCFYRCETVRSSIADQYSLDLKGTLRSFLHVRMAWAKDFVFDVQRTSREAYDFARRQLFNAGAISSTFQSSLPGLANGCNGIAKHPSTTEATVAVDHSCTQEDTCCICLEALAAVRFTPCRHLACCCVCSLAIENCPICRCPIKERTEEVRR